MKATLITAPTIEPVTLAQAKMHLRLDSETMAGDLTSYQSLPPASYAIAADYITHVGASVDVLGKQALIFLESGTNGATGTVDCKIQDSDDNVIWTDVTSGAFTQVTTANDNATQEKAYAGSKQYIRTVAKVLLAGCVFGTSVVVNAATTAEDDLLTDIIQAARENVEDITRRALLTQTWEYYLDAWPDEDFIRLPFGNLQTVTSIIWKDTDGTGTTLTAGTDYLVETNGEDCGFIVLPYGETWPSGGTLYTSNPITIKFVCGWTAANLIPSKIKSAVKMIIADLWENRESQIVSLTMEPFAINKTVMNLLSSARLWSEF